MKFIWCLLLIFFFNFVQASEVTQPQKTAPVQPTRFFKPSIKNCGGSVRHRTFIKDIECMKAGFKDVTLTDQENVIRNKTYDFKALGIKMLDLNDLNKQVILYTPAGKKNALLLAKYYQLRSSVGQKNPQITYLAPNHYLVGHLLGYSDKDIKNYYRGTFSDDLLISYNNDKRLAEELLKESEAWIPQKIAETNFVPSEKTCGAALTTKSISRSTTDDQEFACMLAGFKQVMLTSISFLKGLQEKDPDILSKNNIKYFEVKKFDEIILYKANNPHATHNAYLFKLYRTEFLNNKAKYISFTPPSTWRTYFNRIRYLFKRPNWDEILHENAYLQGYLLGYSNNDIKYYYQYNYSQPSPNDPRKRTGDIRFKEDKEKAEAWLIKHDPLYFVK